MKDFKIVKIFVNELESPETMWEALVESGIEVYQLVDEKGQFGHPVTLDRKGKRKG